MNPILDVRESIFSPVAKKENISALMFWPLIHVSQPGINVN